MQQCPPTIASSSRVCVDVSAWDLEATRTFEANRAGLIAAASRIAGPQHAADVVQDVFLRVWSNSDAFDPTRGTLTRYFYMVTRGIAIDRLRSRNAAQVRETNDARQPSSADDDHANRVVRGERTMHIRAALDNLRPAEREVIEAAFYQHLSYREVALRFNLPEGTVKSRIRVGLVQLRRELNRHDGLGAA